MNPGLTTSKDAKSGEGDHVAGQAAVAREIERDQGAHDFVDHDRLRIFFAELAGEPVRGPGAERGQAGNHGQPSAGSERGEREVKRDRAQ